MPARMLFRIITAACTLALAGAASAASLDQARSALALGETGRARRILEEYLAANPDRESAGEALYLLGSATPDAALCFQADTRILDDFKGHPRAVDAALRAGQYLYATGEYERAAGLFHDLTQGKNARGRTEGALWLGQTLLALGEVGPAREEFRVAAASQELEAAARLGEGDTYRAESKLRDALERYETAASSKDSPWRAAALFKCALAARDLDELEEARRYAGELRGEYPGSAEAAMALALLPRPAVVEAQPASADTADASGAAAGGTFFSVQVGAFSERENAARLHQEIGGRGFPDARIVPDARGDRVLYSVRFGRYASEEAAREAGREFAGPAGLSFQIAAEGEAAAGAPDTMPAPSPE